MNVSDNDDNAGDLVLARTLSSQLSLLSKYYATKTIWFCDEIVKCGIKVLKNLE